MVRLGEQVEHENPSETLFPGEMAELPGLSRVRALATFLVWSLAETSHAILRFGEAIGVGDTHESAAAVQMAELPVCIGKQPQPSTVFNIFALSFAFVFFKVGRWQPSWGNSRIGACCSDGWAARFAMLKTTTKHRFNIFLLSLAFIFEVGWWQPSWGCSRSGTCCSDGWAARFAVLNTTTKHRFQHLSSVISIHFWGWMMAAVLGMLTKRHLLLRWLSC